VTQHPYSVVELTDYLSDLLDSDEVLANLWIEGEVVESTVSRAGHLFFTMGDSDARLRCVMFRSAAGRQRQLPIAGQTISAHGRISVYPRDGSYQLYADFLRPAGIGLAALEFELLVQRLRAEGLFDEGRKRPIPETVRRLGVITSADGAVWHDIQTTARRRNPFVEVVFCPTRVQGEGASESLCRALDRMLMEGRPDVVIIGRGGGAASDLSAFNDEALARAIFASSVPIVSAVGHETDWTLIDYVADVRAATPSAAAELCTTWAASQLRTAREDLTLAGSRRLREIRLRHLDLDEMNDRMVRRGPLARLAPLQQYLHDTTAMFSARHVGHVGSKKALEQSTRADLTASMWRFVERDMARRERADALLGVLNPKATLARGYAAIEKTADGSPVGSVSDLQDGSRLRAVLKDGSFESIVTHMEQAGNR
jgi:exodeoxyribonuclease VII large subunit